MLTQNANGDSRFSFWPRVREFAVPPSMIETATARRRAGDWAGACAAAGIDVDLSPRSVARSHGRDLAARIRADLRHLAPDLLRWHLPRVAPDGLLRPGLTIALARYESEPNPDSVSDGAERGAEHPVYLVVRTPPAWADSGQRISLALWGGPRFEPDVARHPHPHLRPNRRFRLDLHRHLWDARRSDELGVRSGAGRLSDAPVDPGPGSEPAPDLPGMVGVVAQGRPCAVDRWAAEAGILLRAEGRASGTGAVSVRLGARRRLVLEPVPDASGDRDAPGGPAIRISAAPKDGSDSALPVLPDAATWVLPDLELIRTGAVELDRLHPLVASALRPEESWTGVRSVPAPGLGPTASLGPGSGPGSASGSAPGPGPGPGPAPGPSPSPGSGSGSASGPGPGSASGQGVTPGQGSAPGQGAASAPTPAAGQPWLVECRGSTHRIGLVNGVLAAMDHDPTEIRREELLVELTGTPLPCLRAIDEAHRRPDCLVGVRERLIHGDIKGALAVVEGLLGPDAVLRGGALRDELEAAAARRITYGLFRAGLIEPGPGRLHFHPDCHRPRERRTHSHHAVSG
ncbi:hypothetical protein [Streptomyces sp. NPDC050535]|uniref:hypothetical protein n=1 Tax=Streptomyces sp. NPDC050535 TaxID=3365626 RepID=UPI0037A1E43D